MAKKINTDNTAQMNGIPLGEHYNDDIFQLEAEVFTILDEAEASGIDLLSTNSEVIKGINPTEVGFVTQYQVKDFSKFGIGGEYNTHVGFALNSNAVRFIDFSYAKEHNFDGVEYDSILDGSLSELFTKTLQDYRDAAHERRATVYFEQVKNSGILLNDTSDYDVLYESIGQPAPVDINNMTADEIEYFCLAIGNYYESLGYINSKPVIMLGTKEWTKLAKSESFVAALYNNQHSEEMIKSTRIGEIHDTYIMKYPKLGKGEFAGISRIVAMPGTAHLIERPARPVQYVANANVSTTAGNQTLGTGFIGGTIIQFVMLVDNLLDVNDNPLLTQLYLICGDNTVTQDASLVHTGKMRSDTPTTKLAVNRTLSKMVEATYDGGTGEQNPASATGTEKTVVIGESVKLSPQNVSLKVGATKKISAQFTSETTTDKTGTWTSATTATATVSASGVVTGVAAGTSVITFNPTQVGLSSVTTTVTVTV